MFRESNGCAVGVQMEVMGVGQVIMWMFCRCLDGGNRCGLSV